MVCVTYPSYVYDNVLYTVSWGREWSEKGWIEFNTNSETKYWFVNNAICVPKKPTWSSFRFFFYEWMSYTTDWLNSAKIRYRVSTFEISVRNLKNYEQLTSDIIYQLSWKWIFSYIYIFKSLPTCLQKSSVLPFCSLLKWCNNRYKLKVFFIFAHFRLDYFVYFL